MSCGASDKRDCDSLARWSGSWGDGTLGGGSADAVTHGTDESGSGDDNPHNALDAIHTAAAYLCAHGADTPDSAGEALYA